MEENVDKLKNHDYSSAFIYRPKKYEGPIALDMKPSEACKQYHKNLVIQFNVRQSDIFTSD